MVRLLCIFFLVFAPFACAEEILTICYNYGCLSKAEVRLTTIQLEEVHGLLNGSAGAEPERAAIAAAVAQMYQFAGEQTPIWHDKGGNYADDLVDGRMDCIDHSANTTSWLRLFSEKGWLRFHEVLKPTKRGLIFTHWAARIRDSTSGQRFAVDSWFFDHGHPAAIFTQEEWKAGAIANDTFR